MNIKSAGFVCHFMHFCKVLFGDCRDVVPWKNATCRNKCHLYCATNLNLTNVNILGNLIIYARLCVTLSIKFVLCLIIRRHSLTRLVCDRTLEQSLVWSCVKNVRNVQRYSDIYIRKCCFRPECFRR